MNKRNINNYCSKVIVGLAKKVAQRDANTSCPFFGYQPQLPKEVKVLKTVGGKRDDD